MAACMWELLLLNKCVCVTRRCMRAKVRIPDHDIRALAIVFPGGLVPRYQYLSVVLSLHMARTPCSIGCMSIPPFKNKVFDCLYGTWPIGPAPPARFFGRWRIVFCGTAVPPGKREKAGVVERFLFVVWLDADSWRAYSIPTYLT